MQATWYLPAVQPKHVVLINSATGALQTLYKNFACWLNEHGVAVLTYDYRGIGRSASLELLKNCNMCFSDWGTLDYAAMLNEAKRRFPDTPLSVLGHSIGGVLVGFVPEHPAVRIVTIGAQTCYWKDWHLTHVPMFLARWAVIMPMATRIAGYFPGTRLGYPCDLPAGIASQWSLNCFKSNFMMKSRIAPRMTRTGIPWTSLFSRFNTPIIAIAIDDDPIGTHWAVERLARHFPEASVERVRWSAGEFGLNQIGHFGFARRKASTQMWPALLSLLTEDSSGCLNRCP